MLASGESLRRCENRFFETGLNEEAIGPEAIFALVREAGGRKGILTVRSDAGGHSAIQKTYRLKPDTTYYYELEYRGEKKEEAQFSAVPEIRSALTEEGRELPDLTGNSFSVIQLEKEDFADAEQQGDFFQGLEKSRFHQGKYYGAEMLFAKDKGKNRAYKDQSSITFEVPEEGVSILQFDYEMKGCTGFPDEVYLDINGERWYRNVHLTAGSGTYTHPKMLPAGENKIEFGARFYGTRPAETFIAVDNLKVIRLTDDPELQKMLREDEAGVSRKWFETGSGLEESGFENQNAFQTLKGSLTTPKEILSYAGQEAELLDQVLDAPPHDFIAVKTGNNQKDLVITVPEGKKALHTAVTLHSVPAAQYPVRWTVDGKAFQVRTGYAANETPAEISKHFRVNSLLREGAFNISPGYLYRRDAGYERIEMILAQNLYAPAENGKYFAGTKKQEVFLEDKTFDGTVDFRIEGGGVWEAADFRLYHIEHGVRIYEKDTALESFAVSGGTAQFEVRTEGNSPEEETGTAGTVYRKGETIPYRVTYRDYEGDPSKAQYWRYTHVPANDGMHPEAGKILANPIQRFYVDGKYTVEHWQEDQTGRTDYDQLSNTAELTFYIEGGEGAPWITGIQAQPLPLKTQKAFSLKIGVDDDEKDVLSLTTEVYKDGKRLCQYQKNGITADKTGKYPLTVTEPLVPELPGRYQVVCAVRDESGSGLGTESFWVPASAEIKGSVKHFPAWEKERLAYNKAHPEEFRAENVFWSMEAFRPEAEVTAAAQSVTVEIREYPGKSTVLAKKRGGRYEGTFFDKAISTDLAEKCRKNPAGLTTIHFVFTARFTDGSRASDIVPVLVSEDGSGRIRIHRVY